MATANRTEVISTQLRQELEDLSSSMCKALNDPKRLMVLYTLRDGEYTVGELSKLMGIPQSNTSQHLAVLRDRGLVEAERVGNTVLYSLRHPKVLEAVDLLRDVMGDEISRRQGLRSRYGS